ncbi:MAG TPA: FG-GAP-like repeat-containing protein [Gemmataceae bacterium]
MFSHRFHCVAKPLNQPIIRKRGRPAPLFLERLEDRTVLSLFTSSIFPVGNNPVSQAVGDFNGDGHADLAVINQNSNTVSVLLGNGNGSYAPKTDYTTGTTPTSVVVGDFNGDGKLDLATANFASKSVSVLLGNGDGTFKPRTDFALITSPVSLAVGDFSGDGKLDLAVATEDLSNDYVNMLRGNGDGTFQAPVSTISDSAPKGIVANLEPFSTIRTADFNGDGKLDVVVVNNKDFWNQRSGLFFQGGSVSVLLGNGDGTLQAPQIFAVGISPRNVAVGDFNGDGRTDFAVGNYMSGTLSVFMNTGGGSFTSSTLALTGSPSSLAAGDFNSDGRTDLAVSLAIDFVGTDLTMLFGQAGGSLPTVAKYFAPDFISMSAADVNGDGHLDLVGAINGPANSPSAASVLLNNGNGTLPTPSLVPTPSGVTFSSQVTADFNGDGIPDLVSGSAGLVQLGLGDGFFGDSTPILGGTVAVADIDGNGTPDILVNVQGLPANQVALYLNSPGWDSRTGDAVGFTISAPQQVTAGSTSSVTITAVDALGNPDPNFHGTVDLDSSQAGSTSLNLLGQYNFTVADGGRHTFLFSNLTQAGSYTLSVFAAAMPTVSVPLAVVPGAVAQFAFVTPPSTPAGTPFSFTITAEDKYGNVETGYTGTVHFSALANDTQAVLPLDYTFTAADDGTHTFSATLFKDFGTFAPFLSAKDVATGVSSQTLVFVTPLAPNSLTMTNLSGLGGAGDQEGVTVEALDIFGNVATSYTGTVHFATSDVQASLPADYTFTAADQGRHNFLLAFKKAGTQSLTATDTANTAFTSTQSVSVAPGAPAVWVVTGFPSSTTAGAAQTFTLTAMDAFGNVATNYTGTIHFSSSDAQAILPANYTFTPGDAGRHTFTAAFKTTGPQFLTFTDTVNPAFTSTQSLTVTPAAAASFVVTGFPATTAGVAHTLTVMVKDAFGNLATNYTGTVAFSSSDPLATLPANYTFTAADVGVHTFTATLKKAGTQSITVSDTQTPSATGIETGIAVSAAAVTHFLIVAPTTVTQGVGFSFSVEAVDDFGNVNTGYRGSVHLSSTDATGGTQNFTFSNNDNGVHVFSYTFNALSFQTLTIVDNSNSSISGSAVVDVLPKSGGGGGGGGLA